MKICIPGTPDRPVAQIGWPRPLARIAWLLAMCWLGLALPRHATGQSLLLHESFEPSFPGFNSWTVTDSNAANGLSYWDDVHTSFGSITANGGNWKGYCSGFGYTGTSASPRYATNMQGVMIKSLNFSGLYGANLDFWYVIPSIDSGFDVFRVFVDNTVVFSRSTAQAGWTRVQVPLNAMVGGMRNLRFEFTSGPSFVNEGVYIDDIAVRGGAGPIGLSLSNLTIGNYSGYVLDSDWFLGRSNIQANAVYNVENFTGTNITVTNVLSFRLINASNSAPHPIYGFGNVNTNAGYVYNITNVTPLAAASNAAITSIAYLRPAARLDQFTQYFVECRVLTNGVLAGTLTTSPTNFYHFTNTAPTDLALNALVRLTNTTWSRVYEVKTIPGLDSFRVTADYEVRRWDDTGAGTATDDVPIVFNYTLRESNGTVVPLVFNSQAFLEPVPNYIVPFFAGPAFVTGSRTLEVVPAGQLDSVGKTYYLTVTIGHTNNPSSGQVITANSLLTSTNRLLDFNGTLRFGAIATTMDGLVGAPPVNPPAGGFISTTLGSVSGTINSSPSHSYSGGPVIVNLNSAGTAFVTGGSVAVSAPVPDADAVAGVRFQRGPITMNSGGANATVRVTLPTGFGYRTNNINSPVLYSQIQFGSTPLNGSLNPSVDLTFMPGVTIYAAEEAKPSWLVTDRIVWFVSAGRFETAPILQQAIYVRADEYALLQSVSNNLVDPPTMGDKRSNEKYWLQLAGLSTPATVNASAQSNALLTTEFKFNPGGFRTHFPYNSTIQFTAGGNMNVKDDLVVPGTSSQLDGVNTVATRYSRDCEDCGGAGAGLGSPAINPTNSALQFTRDGGLVAGGPTLATVNLQWGFIGSLNDYAQQARQFNQAAYHMPGAFVRGDQNLLPRIHGPTTILYSGFAVSNLTLIERPGSAAYAQGFADYAGMNFRVLTDAAHKGRSTIAGKTNINWDLTGRSKYYVRWAGVSGIHEAVPGSFPASLTLWGYDFTFTSYGLSYLDSLNKESRTDGAVDLPYPSDFIQGFDNMKFSCLGAPVSAELPQGDGFKVMAYWLADFKTHSIQFKSNNGCDPTEGYLVLGLEGYASHVTKPLFGYVGFFNNGDHIPRSFGLEGVYSRLKAPNIIELAGPNKTAYQLTPAADAYYNTHAGSPPSEPGWMNIFGKLDVPFFEDLQIHFQTSCRTNGTASSNAPIYLSGGWPRSGTGNPNYGWLESGKTPFQTNHFDWANRGWPNVGGLTIANYRDNENAQDYHPRAQRLWLDVVDFDYPLSWNRTLRNFKSWRTTSNDFFVLQVQHEVKYMDAKQAELTFGAQYDGLPQVSIANFAFNAIDEATGMGSAIVKAATQPVFDLLNAGLDELNQMLDTQMNRLMDGVFDRTIDPIIDNWYSTLSNQWAVTWNSLPLAQKQQFVLSVHSNLLNHFVGNGVAPVANNLSRALRDVGSVVNQANNLIGQAQTYLGNASNAICSVIDVVAVGTNNVPLGSNVVGLISKVGGERPVLPSLVQNIVGEIAPEFIDAVLGPTLNSLIDEIEPALAQITEGLQQTKQVINQTERQLAAAGEFTTELDNIIKSFSTQLTNVSLQVTLATTQYFGQLNYAVDNPFQHLSADDIKKFIRQKVEDHFFATDAAAQVQTALRQRLYDVDAKLREEIDSVFQQVNVMMRELIGQSLAELDNTINKALGDISDTIGAGQINGHALIVGDSLKCLRIDAKFQWKAPDAMEFNAFLQIKEIDSDGTPGCVSSNAPWTEVTIGATEVSLDWISPDLSCNVQTKFTFDGTIPFPVNMAGQLELLGVLSFEAFELYDLAAAVAFGKYENYLALKGGVRFNSYDFAGAIFLGRTCSLDPLKLIDPDVAEVLGNPPFTGGYVYAQGWLPVSELVLGIPASCLFNISAGVGAGAFYFVEGPTYGGKMFLGVSGELLCIVSIQGDITMVGVKQGDDLRFKGRGHFEAEVGPCPFCISVSKDVEIKYVNKKWSID
jgi:hypothetical protein